MLRAVGPESGYISGEMLYFYCSELGTVNMPRFLMFYLLWNEWVGRNLKGWGGLTGFRPARHLTPTFRILRQTQDSRTEGAPARGNGDVSGFQPSCLALAPVPQPFGLGWYGVGPSALNLD